ncbi:putative tyrosinase-like protein tyr-3 [Mercenaria mercenaria]|uniref:putative tyrosinase-like protein tyr-3 n=1 Tax=Mercenaria mercenaria TaxID=6596 RepID=UPI00234EC8E1|nr:putative tyrosinase-like protein tyr-3 [Mercenaria mercenaria]
MGKFSLCSVFVFLMAKAVDTQTTNHQVCMLVPEATHACFRSFEGKPIGQLAARISCLQDLMWNIVPDMSLNEKDRSVLRNISASLGMEPIQESLAMKSNAGGFAGSTQAGTSTQRRSSQYPRSGKRTRKEYRTLSPGEKERFHRALKRLYMDGYIDLFAKIHAEASDKHHSGPSFLPWHRVYITMFEEVLRMYDRSVSLPYWASTFDDAMSNPVNSILWTDSYFGNGEGIVTSGPAAYWVTGQGGLERNYGRGSTLFKKDQIQKVLSQCYLANISRPSAPPVFDLEGYHGGPHVWVGGDMSAFITTGYDPVFYMHHAYVDYIWEQFRRRQRYICGVEPTRDYPEVPVGNSNHPDASMTGFEWLINRDGIRPQWINNWFNYDPEPSCPDCCPNCPSPAPLYCDSVKNTCVSRSKLLDSSGQLSGGFAVAMSLSSARMGSGQQERPRNRGREFDAPPSDGRTVATALQDAMAAAPATLQQQLRTFL